MEKHIPATLIGLRRGLHGLALAITIGALAVSAWAEVPEAEPIPTTPPPAVEAEPTQEIEPTVSEETVTEEEASEEVASEEAASDEVVSEEVVSEEAVSEPEATEEVASEQVASEEAIEEEVTKEEVAEEVTAENVKAEQVVSEEAPFTGDRPAVDVAILLDTSNSMDGLIDQAKQQLWGIVKQFSLAEKQGKTPTLRVAVFEYGNTNLPANEGYIRQVVPLTTDLDLVSEGLFALTTQGGDEYCGMVIDEALTRLDWSEQENAYKAIFIAGNEPFTQGEVDYKEACARAIQAGVVVNTIHCGNRQQGIEGQWGHGAQLAEGEFLNINQDQRIVHIPAPQDQLIIQLNGRLNATYLWFGEVEIRNRLKTNQIAQDTNNLALSAPQMVARAEAKVSSAYDNRGRDLVDTYNNDPEAVLAIEKDKLPEALQELSKEELIAEIEKMSAEREEIKKEIKTANAEREAYVANERAKLADENDELTLGEAMQQAVRGQLKEAGYSFDEAE